MQRLTLTTDDGIEFEAEVAGPEDSGRALLLIHDWWGVLDYNRDWATRFAKLGWRTLVIDLYDGEHAIDAEEAGEMMRSLDQDVADMKLLTALQHLRGPDARRRVAVLGWSLGGYQALQATLLDPESVDATVLFYCRLNMDVEALATIRGPVLSVFAEQEPTWPEKMERFRAGMTEAGRALEMKSYDAGHGFANPKSSRYDGAAAENAFGVSREFLERTIA